MTRGLAISEEQFRQLTAACAPEHLAESDLELDTLDLPDPPDPDALDEEGEEDGAVGGPADPRRRAGIAASAGTIQE